MGEVSLFLLLLLLIVYHIHRVDGFRILYRQNCCTGGVESIYARKIGA